MLNFYPFNMPKPLILVTNDDGLFALASKHWSTLGGFREVVVVALTVLNQARATPLRSNNRYASMQSKSFNQIEALNAQALRRLCKDC